MKRNLVAAVLLLVLANTLTACPGPYPRYYSAEAIEASIIDADTRQPLEGVVAVAHWPLLGGIEGNRPIAQLMVMEAVSDEMAAPSSRPGVRSAVPWGISATRIQPFFFSSPVTAIGPRQPSGRLAGQGGRTPAPLRLERQDHRDEEIHRDGRGVCKARRAPLLQS